MTAGIPGAGIGGLFYLVGALVAPGREVFRAVRGDRRPRQWSLVFRQFLLANVILGSLAITGWVLGALAEFARNPVLPVSSYSSAGSEYAQLIGWNTGLLTSTVLLVVVMSVEVLRLMVRPTGRIPRITVLIIMAVSLTGESAGQELQVRSDTKADLATKTSELPSTADSNEIETWRELGIAHQRAGRYKQASAAFARALALAPRDETILRQLELVRLRLAPAIEMGTVIAGETGISRFGPSVAADFAAGDRARIGMSYTSRRVSTGGDAASTQRFGARFGLRPRSDMNLDLRGSMWSSNWADGTSDVRPEMSARFRNRFGAEGPRVDVRGERQIVDVSPDLARTPLVTTQLSGHIDVPVAGPIRLRGDARIASVEHAVEGTRRTAIGGGLAVAVSSDIRATGRWHVTRHRNPLTSGYFAPPKAKAVEIGLELEREYDRATVSVDVGGGIQRVQKVGLAIRRWTPGFRGWGLLTWTVTPRQHLLFEFEAYDSRIPNTISAVERWRYVSSTASWRLLLASSGSHSSSQ